MRRKAKGIRAERELMDLFWRGGLATLRVAGSGSTSHPSTDLIAAVDGRIFVIEVKTTSKDYVYIRKEEVDSLQKLSAMMGAESWIAIKFSKERGKFFMVKLEDARITNAGAIVDLETAKSKGIDARTFASIAIGKQKTLSGFEPLNPVTDDPVT